MSFHIVKELFKRFPMMVSALKSDASKYLYGMPKLEAKFYHGGKKILRKLFTYARLIFKLFWLSILRSYLIMFLHFIKELFRRFWKMESAQKWDASKYLCGMPKLEAKFFSGGNFILPKWKSPAWFSNSSSYTFYVYFLSCLSILLKNYSSAFQWW